APGPAPEPAAKVAEAPSPPPTPPAPAAKPPAAAEPAPEREVAETTEAPVPRPRARKPVQPAAGEAPITGRGELVLLIRPWAKVEVDGREIGVTPLNEPLMLGAGEHVVRLVNPDLGKDITRTVHISPSGRSVLKELLDE